MGLGEICSLASAFVWAIAIILFKASGESLSTTALNLYKNGLATLLFIPTVLVVEGPRWPAFAGSEWAIILASGVIGIAIADTLYLQALRTMGASRTGIAATLYSPSVVLLSFAFLGERLSAPQFAGFLLVVAALVIVAYRSEQRELDAAAVRKGMVVGITAVMLMAAGVVMVKPVLEQGPFLWIVLLRVAAGFVGQFLVAASRNRLKTLRAEFSGKHDWLRLNLASILATYVAMLLWLAGYRYTDASIASVLNETASIFIVLLAWRVLGESMTPRKSAGVVMSFSGVLLIVTG